MIRKDYQLIADALKSARMHYVRDDAPEGGAAFAFALQGAAEELALRLAADNPRFDRERFLAACGVQS